MFKIFLSPAGKGFQRFYEILSGKFLMYVMFLSVTQIRVYI